MDQMIAINKIYNEDCLDGMQKIDDKSIDLICTDLPYGQTARNKWDSVIPFEPLWEQYERIIKDNGAIILFGNGMFTADLMPTYNPQKTSGHPRKVSKTEHKRNSKKSTDYREYDFVSYDSTERYPTSIWKFPKDTQKSALHPTQKPVALIEEIIKTYTNPGDLVLDSAAGSCTTAVAAINTGRNYICFEKDKEFYEIGCKRV